MDVEKRFLTGIDLAKFLAAIVVIWLHAGLFYSFHDPFDKFLINAVCRWAVPFFFLTNGYFMSDSWRNVFRHIARLLALDFIWSVLYILLLGWEMPAALGQIFPINNIVIPFWYFLSLSLCLLLLLLLKYLFRGNHALILGFASVCYLLALLGDSYYNLLPNNPIYRLNDTLWGYGTRNGFLFGLLFVCLGNTFRDKNRLQKLADKFSVWGLACITLGSFIIAAIEALIYKNFATGIDFNVTVSSLLVAPCVMLLALKIRVEQSLSLFLRKTSILMYTTHWYYVNTIRKEIFTNSIVRFILILGLSILTSVAIASLSKKCKLLRWLC